jgi:hypothetical protein
MDLFPIESWFSHKQQTQLVTRLLNRVGLTRRRAECFVRLWVYLLIKEQRSHHPHLKPPLSQLGLLSEPGICTHREAAQLFYANTDQGSDRSAGMMLDKLVALGLIKKSFDGNTTRIEICPIPELLEQGQDQLCGQPLIELKLDNFDPRSDAIPVANLLATNYNWMNRNADTVPYRIARLLRRWASHYAVGMRVLRRCDNLHPVGFYLLYPVTSESEINFFNPPSQGLHLSVMTDIDPFTMATVGDSHCLAVFIRSWMIDPMYLEHYRVMFVIDAQQTLKQMQLDFPNLCDLYTLVIHPGYERLASALGFQKTGSDSQLSVYWMYLGLDRFLALDVATALQNV